MGALNSKVKVNESDIRRVVDYLNKIKNTSAAEDLSHLAAEVKEELKMKEEKVAQILTKAKFIARNDKTMAKKFSINSKINGMENAFLKQKIYHEVKDSFKPIRNLHQTSPAEIEQKREEENAMENKKDEKPVKKEAEKKEVKKAPTPIRTEATSEFFEKNKSFINLDNFEIEYREEGMNPIEFVEMIKFDLDITQIIKNKFKKKEKIKNNIIRLYLSLRPKIINFFNHNINEKILSEGQMNTISHEYLEAKQKLMELTDPLEIQEQKNKIKAVMHKIGFEVQAYKDKKEMKKIKKKMKDMAIEAKSRENTVLNHHVDQEDFHSNFTGIKDLFVKLFGT